MLASRAERLRNSQQTVGPPRSLHLKFQPPRGSDAHFWPPPPYSWQQGLWRITFGHARTARAPQQRLRKSASGTNRCTARLFLLTDMPWRLSFFQVFLMLTSGGEPLQLTNDEGDKFVNSFSPDGKEVYYGRTLVVGGRNLGRACTRWRSASGSIGSLFGALTGWCLHFLYEG